MKVLIAAPVRDRAWVLPEYLKAIENLIFDGNIQYYFLINDSTDNSKQILEDFQQRKNNCVIEEINYNTPKDERNGVRSAHTFYTLANLRNHILEYFLSTDCDILYSIDTDVIVKPESLQELIKIDADITSTFIFNTKVQKWNRGNVLIGIDKIKHIDAALREEVFNCSVTGAVYIIKRKVIEAGCKYAWHRLGEDIPFCLGAINKGFIIKCTKRKLAEHYMSKRVFNHI